GLRGTHVPRHAAAAGGPRRARLRRLLRGGHAGLGRLDARLAPRGVAGPAHRRLDAVLQRWTPLRGDLLLGPRPGPRPRAALSARTPLGGRVFRRAAPRRLPPPGELVQPLDVLRPRPGRPLHGPSPFPRAARCPASGTPPGTREGTSMNVVIVGGFWFPYGSANAARFRNFALGLQECGARVHVISMVPRAVVDGEAPARGLLEHEGISYECVAPTLAVASGWRDADRTIPHLRRRLSDKLRWF